MLGLELTGKGDLSLLADQISKPFGCPQRSTLRSLTGASVATAAADAVLRSGTHRPELLLLQ